MEDDIDIYADLPSFDLNLDKNDQPCNCEKLNKELISLKSELEKIQKIKENLEKNISSLLKTAKAEITRKDKMISDLRKRLDDTTFRRNNKGDSRDFSTYKSSHQQHTIEKYENAPLKYTQEDEIVLHETEFHCNEHKNEKLEYSDQQPTVFAERLYKRIIKDEKENTKQKTSLKLDIKIKKEIAEENVVESDKENGSQSNINNNDNESNTITRHSDSENLCKNNSGKRMNEEDDTRGSKRVKIDDSEDKIDDYDSTVQYELKDDLAQYEMKAKFEDQLNAIHPLKEEEISLDKHKAASEHLDKSKQSRDCTNGWKREKKNSSRTNYIAEEPNDYKKNVYSSRYSSRRSYSRSRSDYESSSGHRLRERSNRTYRKYDDYKYDNQYRTKRDYRLKRDYKSVENESKTRHRKNRERDMERIKSKHSSSDVEDKEGNSSYTNERYESRRIKKTAVNISYNKDLYERDKIAVEMNSRASSSHTIVNNTINHNVKKTIKQDKVKNESNIKSVDSTESMSTKDIATKDLSNLEEGEIVDSPEKKIDSMKISKDHKVVENNTKIVLIENKNKDVPLITDDKSTSILQNDIITAKQLNNTVTDSSTKQVETTSCLVQTTRKNPREDPGEIAELNSSDKSDAIVNDVQNRNNVEDICKSQCNENLMDSTTCIIGMIEQVCESQCNEDLTNSITCTIGTINRICNNNVDDKNRVEGESKISVSETAIKNKEMTDINTESIEVRRIDEPNIESAINKDKVNSSNFESPVIIAEANNSDNNNRKIDDKELKNSTVEIGKVEMLNYDIENKDANQVSSKISRQISGKNSEINNLCLSDHNYVQDPSVNASDSNVIRDSLMSPEHCETVPEAATIKETKPEKEIDVSLTVDVKKIMSSTIKNKKNQLNKGVVISRRRRAVTLSDSNASMTVLMNTKTSSNVISNSSNESILKPRACKASRACK